LTSSLKFWQRPKSKDSFKEVSGFDLFYQLTYMSAVAAAGISRSRIFQLGSELSRAPSEYFERIHLLAQKLSYDYSRACRTIGATLQSDKMKSLLLRLSSALISGEPEAEFLSQEAHITGITYENEYERDLANLTKWTDAYAAVVVSAALILIINLVSTMIYKMGIGMIMGLMIVSVLTSSMGAWILSRAAPREVRGIFSLEGPREQRLARKLSKILPLAALIICVPLALSGIELGWILIVASLIVLPLGVVSVAGDKQISKKDSEIGSFFRSLGGMATSTGTTITESLTRLDLKSFPALEPDVERLRRRLIAAISPELCWKKFALETGSKLISETTDVFKDAVNLGGDPDKVGLLCSLFAAKTIMLRAKRRVITSTFSWLTITMHGTIGALIIIIVKIIDRFLSLIETAMAAQQEAEATQSMAMSMPLLSFSAPEIQLLHVMAIGMVILLAITNAFAILAADGGHILKGSFYLSILLFLSGASFILVPPIVGLIM
jgi:flagellar protein FlaJ